MDFSTWLEAEIGRAAAVAKHFNVSRSAVSQWKTNGVPVANMTAVRELSGGVVTLEAMLADASRSKQQHSAIPAEQGAA